MLLFSNYPSTNLDLFFFNNPFTIMEQVPIRGNSENTVAFIYLFI